MKRQYSFPRSLRVLPPAGGFASPRAALKIINQLSRISEETDQRAGEIMLIESLGYSQRKAAFTGSGKQALQRIFEHWSSRVGHRVVGVAAYTCPDIAAAAVRAGWRVRSLEINGRTLDIDASALSAMEELGAVVLSNLYGLPDSLKPWEPFSDSLLLVDDACQAALSFRSAERIGQAGNAGVLSFGRGKALCGIGGGAVLLPDANFSETEVNMQQRQDVEAGCGKLSARLGLLYGAMLSLFERPYFYRLPASLPFLGLGVTKCEIDFNTKPIGCSQIGFALAQAEEVRAIGLVHRSNALRLSKLLDNLSLVQPFVERGGRELDTVVPIRYPVLFEDKKQRDHCLIDLAKAGLGASASYPAVLPDYPELAQYMVHSEIPQARSVAARILTLPVHRYVTESDLEQITSIVTKYS